MNIQKNDYVVVLIGTRKMLVEVTSIGSKGLHGVIENLKHDNPEHIDFLEKNIIAWLGPRPVTGSAYGVSIEPYWRTIDHSLWGPVRLYSRISKATWKAVNSGLVRAYKALDAKGLTGFIESSNLAIEVRPSRGKNLGMYYHSTFKGEPADRMLFRLQEHDHPELYKEVILHEAGHGVYYRLLTPEQRLAWLKIHIKYCTFKKHDSAAIIKLGKKFLLSAKTPSIFASELDEDQGELFRIAYREMLHNYRLKNADIIDLLEFGKQEEIRRMWPNKTIEYSEFEELIGDYATKNPQELHAETFRLIFTKTKIPAFLKETMLKQLSAVKGK